MTSLRVECYAGHRGEETPRRFTLRGATIEIARVVDRWLAPDHRYFKVEGEDGCLYIIRQDVATGDWELTSFDAGRAGGVAPPPARGGRPS